MPSVSHGQSHSKVANKWECMWQTTHTARQVLHQYGHPGECTVYVLSTNLSRDQNLYHHSYSHCKSLLLIYAPEYESVCMVTFLYWVSRWANMKMYDTCLNLGWLMCRVIAHSIMLSHIWSNMWTNSMFCAVQPQETPQSKHRFCGLVPRHSTWLHSRPLLARTRAWQ